MRIQDNPHLASQLLAEFSHRYSEDRSGQHPSVSDLISCLTKRWYDVKGDVKHSDQTQVYFLIGLGLEKAILEQRQVEEKAGEYDGVYYHLDSLDQGWFELKSTRKSPNPRKDGSTLGGAEGYLAGGFALRQFLSYAKTQGVLEMDLGIIWLIQGQFNVYHITFTQEEVDKNWEWLSERRDVWMTAEATGVAPRQYTYNEPFECKGCDYQMLCEYNRQKELGVISGH